MKFVLVLVVAGIVSGCGADRLRRVACDGVGRPVNAAVPRVGDDAVRASPAPAVRR